MMTDTTTIKTDTDLDNGVEYADLAPTGFHAWGEEYQRRGLEGCVFCGRAISDENPKTVCIDSANVGDVAVVRENTEEAKRTAGDAVNDSPQGGNAWEVGSTCYKKLAAALAKHDLYLV